MLIQTRPAPLLRRTAVIFLLLLSFLPMGCAPAVEKLDPEQVASLLPDVLKLHVKQHDMDEPFMRRLLTEYVNELDRDRSSFLKSEADAIVALPDRQLTTLAKETLDGDFSYYKTVLRDFLAVQVARDNDFYAGLDQRADEIKALAKEEIKPGKGAGAGMTPKSALEAAEGGKEWTERAATNEERRKRLLREAADLYAFDKTYLSATDAFKETVATLQEERAKWLNVGDVDQETLVLFLKSFMVALDPHSEYLDGDDETELAELMERSFAGIGVQIRPCPLGAQVEDIIKGGPAEKSRKFDRGDQIVAVDGTVLAGMPINKIVKLIKGERGTQVKITLLKREERKTDVIALSRDTIELAGLRVKGKTYETPNGTVGVISVQAFYDGVHEDVKKRIRELAKDKPLAGVVLDLRFNTGGFLEEAVKLAGLFIKSGVIVGERDGQNHESWESDPDRSIAYAGPLVVLTNQFSASASEIVAGALQAYDRALIVAHTPTFGKGSVQTVLPLDTMRMPGELKLTVAEYYLPDGSSVQMKGVAPDVDLPGTKLLDEDGLLERASPGALPWSRIGSHLDANKPEVKLWRVWKASHLSEIQQLSAARVKANPAFVDAFDESKPPKHVTPKAGKTETPAEPANPNQPPPLVDEDQEKDYQAEEAADIVGDMVPTWPVLPKIAATWRNLFFHDSEAKE